jgi:hypothetical protein
VIDNLTFNLGVRYEYDWPRRDLVETMSFFNFTKINPVCDCPGVIEFGSNKWATTGKHTPGYNAENLNLAPRFGFAWSPIRSRELVVRGGYGIFYLGNLYHDRFWAPWVGVATNEVYTTRDNGITPAFVLSQGFPDRPAERFDDRFGAVPIGQTPRVSPFFYWQDRVAAYMQQFNLGIQKRLGKAAIEVAYLGNLGRKLAFGATNYNEVRPGDRGPGNAQIRRPFPQFGDVIGQGQAKQTSNYHAFLVDLKRHFAQGLSFQTNYTFAKALSNVSYKRSDYDRRADYGPDALGRRHRFVWASVYELPWGPEKRFLRSGPLANILGGWSLANIVNFQSGARLNMTSVVNTCNCFTSGTQGVNLIGNPKKDNGNFDPGRDTWFNTGAFAFPASFTFGNAGSGIVEAPSVANIDATLTKRLRIHEDVSLDIRGEFFNFPNHANFNAPSTVFGSPAFGRVSSAQPGRAVQLGLKLFF